MRFGLPLAHPTSARGFVVERSLNERRAEWVNGPDETSWLSGASAGRGIARSTSPLFFQTEWMMVRAKPNQLVVAPGRVADEYVSLFDEFPGFWFVEKLGEAGAVAKGLADSD